MNVSIRRQGIVIKSVPVNNERARIGSGADCEIQLNDPFLAPVVAELVKRGTEWYLVDSGTSLEGVTHGGVRVVDELVEPGLTYVVGAFELVTDGNMLRRSLSGATPNPDEYIPMTVVEADLRNFPGTMIQPSMTAGGAGQRSARVTSDPPAQRIAFAPVAPTAAPASTLRPTAARRPEGATFRRVLLVVLAGLATIVLTLAVLMGGRKLKPRSAATKSAPASTPAATRKTATLQASGDELARRLEIEKAFATWESELAAKPSVSSSLQHKVAIGAFELARGYAAIHDTVNAARYFEKVVRYGVADSEEVRYARARLQRR